MRGHRQEDSDSVPFADADRGQPLRESEDFVGELLPGQGEPCPVLREPGGRLLLRQFAGSPLMDAVPREIQLRSDEPRRPFRAARRVGDALPGLRELEAEVFDHGRPEPLRFLNRDAVQLPVSLGSEQVREARDVRVLDLLRGRRPDELAHGSQGYG